MDIQIKHTTDYALYSQVHDALYSYNLSKTGAVRQDVKAAEYPDGEALVILGDSGVVYGGIVWHWQEEHTVVRTDYFFIDEALRGTGYGVKVFTEFETLIKNNGARAISLGTNSFQAPGFYEKMGFKVVEKELSPQPDFPENIKYEFIKEFF